MVGPQLLVYFQLLLLQRLHLLEMTEMVLQEHVGVLDGVLGSHEDEWHVALNPGHGWGRFIVSFNLDSDNTALVNDLLDEPTILSYHFSN